MQLRPLLIALACGGLAWGGYELSHVRANSGHRPFSDVLAAAGEEPAYLADASGASGTGSYRISSLSVFSNVALHVKDNYVDPDRIEPQEMLVSALNEIERQIAEVMVEDMGGGKLRVRVMDEEKVLVIDDVASLWEINLKLREVFRFFEKHLPPQKDVRAIEYAAVNGALSTLDPHSVLLKPEAFQEMKTSTKGEFGGLGIVISVRDNRLTVISPLGDTPAARAGLKAGDIISRIGDVSTVSMAIEEAVRMLRGPEGSKVTIWVDRKSWTEPRKFSIVRERIKIESVESELLSDNVGYIKIKNFQQNTGKDLEDHLGKLAKKADGKLEGLVLDLRNNPGGLLEQAIRVSDKFLTSGDIVTTVGYGNKLREPKRARWSGTESTLPIAVLVNKGSASASEIVAGALKNLDRAVIMGETTFGKGSVQVLYDFADNSALKLTIAQYLTPGGISIQNEGVTPDVALTPAWIQESGVRLFHRPKGHRENSLDKHLDRAGQDYVKEKPAFTLTHLMEKQDDDEERDPNAFREDYQITLAKDFLRASGAASRSKTLQRAKDFFTKRQLVEHDRIAAAIGELDVDWRDLEGDTEKVGLQAEVELRIDDASTAQIQAGEEVSVTATVKNTSGVPLHQLRGVLDSEHPSFRGRELLFGYLEPGASRTWTVKTRIPKDTPPRSDLVALDLTSARGKLSERVSMPVVTKYVDHPRFAYQFLYDDKERGDGDGQLEPGEGAEFVVLVTNLGPGDADEVSLRLKSGAKKNLFLERGRASIGKIASGETKPGRLKFRVPKGVEPGLDLPVELTIYDAGSGEWMEDEIRLQAAAPAKDKIAAADRPGVVVRKPVAAMASLQEIGQAAARPVATLPKGAKLKATGKTKGAFRVDLGEGMEAWVDAASVSTLRRLKAPKLADLAFSPKRRTPTIDLESDPGGAVVNTETAVLAGKVRGDALRDMYVLLNDEKVFFRSGPTPAGTTDGDVELPFSVKLPLEEGLNKVLVVARLDEKVVSYRSLFISRRGAAVAEASPKAE